MKSWKKLWIWWTDKYTLAASSAGRGSSGAGEEVEEEEEVGLESVVIELSEDDCKGGEDASALAGDEEKV